MEQERRLLLAGELVVKKINGDVLFWCVLPDESLHAWSLTE